MDLLTQPSETDSIAAQAARSNAVVEELPTNRQYARSVDHTLDEALVAAIAAAEAAENTAVATLLRFELSLHSLDCRR